MNFQTGSGKTFTITGGAERYVDRGLIPRSLSYIFDYFEKVSDLISCSKALRLYQHGFELWVIEWILCIQY